MTAPIASKTIRHALIAVFAVNVIALMLSRAQIVWAECLGFALVTGVLALWYFASLRLIQRQKQPKPLLVMTNQVIEVLLLLQLAWINLQLLNHLSMMLPFPYADDLLAGFDRALGINWLAYFELVHASPTAILLLDYSYVSLSAATIAAMIGPILWRDPQRARFFVETYFLTVMICIIVGAAFPAQAAVVYHVPDLAAYGNFPTSPGTYHLETLAALRDTSGPVLMTPLNLPGLVTFPSFHTAAGIILSVTFWRTRLFVPTAIYSALMIASTPVFSGHYITDLIVGTALAALICYLYAQKPHYASLFRRTHTTPPKAPATTGDPVQA